jgi:phosphoribosyl 1,2-cyclic phosphodiesterase
MPTALKACALRSGSSGNAVFIGGGKTRLLVDAGVCCKDIEQSLEAIGEQAANLDGLLITHEHSDHIAGVGPLLRRYQLPIFTTRATWLAMRRTIGRVDDAQIHFIEPDEPFCIGDLAVTGFSTAHDAADPVGYRVDAGTSSLAVLTDTGHLRPGLTDAVAGCQAIFLEANYDYTMLLAGSYPAMLKQRILGNLGHLSNDDCADAVCLLLEQGTRHFILSHISKENNFPELALLTVSSRLNQIGARPDEDFRLDVARRFEVSAPICL